MTEKNARTAEDRMDAFAAELDEVQDRDVEQQPSEVAVVAVDDEETLSMVRGAMDAGAAGVSMGRSIFQHADPEAITAAIAAVVHDDADASAALERAGLAVEA